jgi:iron complex outermembrane recepter protein
MRVSSVRPFWIGLVGAVGVGAPRLSSVAGAQDTVAHRLPPVVTVTRDVGRSPLDLPYAITSSRPDSVSPGQAHTLVEQTLSLLPGVTVANRSNPSQDARVSVRGFGARSAFGVRSIRILRDGIPLTLPDGQTPIDYLDLESVGSVESIRGSAAALYGNASGGVIDLRSATPPAAPAVIQGRSWLGSNGLRRTSGLFAGMSPSGGTSYQGSIGRTSSDGYRDYAHQRLTNAFLRAVTTIGGTEVALDGMGLDMPLAENPGALTRAQLDSNARAADASSVRKRTRKAVHQVQVGLTARRPFATDGELSAQAYGGTRSLYNPLTFAVVGVDRRSGGAGVRATLPLRAGGIVHRVSAGADAQWLNDARKNWANCNAVVVATANCPSLMVEKGILQLNQRELVSSVGPYIRDELEVGRLRATAGLRADNVRFEVRDADLSDGRDDSGSRTLRALSPMLGVAARLSPWHAAYVNVASSFETPTTTELGNQADGSAGLNRDLKPQYSSTYEAGMKGLAASRVQYDVAVFETAVRDELIAFEVASGNGRTYFRNAGRTRRRGVELSFAAEAGPASLAASYAWSHFRFRDFSVGASQYAGNAIPGIPEQQLQSSATWRIRRAYAVAEVQGKSKVYVNDANIATAPGFVTFNLRAGGTAVLGRPWLSPVVGVQNLFDRHTVGSVAINAAGTVSTAKFYEPAPGRSWLVGVSAATGSW